MVNNKLKARIVEKFGSQSDLAEVLKIDASIISKVVRGRKSLCETNQLLWAKALGYKIEEFQNLIKINN